MDIKGHIHRQDNSNTVFYTAYCMMPNGKKTQYVHNKKIMELTATGSVIKYLPNHFSVYNYRLLQINSCSSKVILRQVLVSGTFWNTLEQSPFLFFSLVTTVMAMVWTRCWRSPEDELGRRLTCSERKAHFRVFLEPASRRSPSLRLSSPEADQ